MRLLSPPQSQPPAPSRWLEIFSRSASRFNQPAICSPLLEKGEQNPADP